MMSYTQKMQMATTFVSLVHLAWQKLRNLTPGLKIKKSPKPKWLGEQNTSSSIQI